MTQSTSKVDDLINKSRFPESLLGTLAVIIYFPFGLLLVLVRVFIGIHAYLVASISPKSSIIRRIVLRVFYVILGIFVNDHGHQNKNKDSGLIVSNHVSIFDHLAIDIVMPNYMPYVLGNLGLWGKILGYIDFYSKKTDDDFETLCKEYISTKNVSLLVFPEGSKTNGKQGLLKYNTKTFSLGIPVQPIAIQIQRPVDISVTVVNSSWVADAFWFLFVPYSYFDLRILPVVEPAQNGEVEFSQKVQNETARTLQLVATDINAADMVAYKQLFVSGPYQTPVSKACKSGKSRCIKESTSTPLSTSLLNSPTCITRGSLRSSWQSSSHEEDERIEAMSKQVKEVLPHVPLDAIRKDLAITRDVDLTLTNVLEGKVIFIFEDQTKSETRSNKPTQLPSTHVFTAAKTFPKASKDRHISLEERKKKLIDAARQQYIAQHGS